MSENKIVITSYERDGKQFFDVNRMVDGKWIQSYYTESWTMVEREIEAMTLLYNREFAVVTAAPPATPTLWDLSNGKAAEIYKWGYEPEIPGTHHVRVWDYNDCLFYMRWRVNSKTNTGIDLIREVLGGYEYGNNAYYRVLRPDSDDYEDLHEYERCARMYDLWDRVFTLDESDLFWVSW